MVNIAKELKKHPEYWATKATSALHARGLISRVNMDKVADIITVALIGYKQEQ